MPDPRLISRAQRAATMLEKAWDRWRAAHGLAAEPLPPVSSYVGYSIEEPWGRPRVVFGVDAADAEKLATLLQECATPQATALQQPPVPQQAVPQQAMAGAAARIPAQGRAGELDETLEHRSDETPEHRSDETPEHRGGAAAEAVVRPDDQADADRVPEDATADLAVHRNDDASGPAGPDGSVADTTGSVADTAGSALDEDLDDPAGQDDPVTPGNSGDGPGDDEGRPSAEAEDHDAGEPAVRYMPEADGSGEAGHSVTDSMVAELAGWASGELPGQASARLAAWAAAAGTTPRSGLDAELHTGSAAAESVV
jgi:hypothetical protein